MFSQNAPEDMDENTIYSAKGSSWDEEEQDYEMVPRKNRSDTSNLVEGLPIKVNGKVERKLHKAQEKPKDDDEEDEDSNDSSEDDEDLMKNKKQRQRRMSLIRRKKFCN
ncbi:hypothetical protein FOB22_001991 [Saccharomyces cerevisiae]|nr:hypothetical protein FOB22_001991 [Saccharomyces cerevisiae]